MAVEGRDWSSMCSPSVARSSSPIQNYLPGLVFCGGYFLLSQWALCACFDFGFSVLRERETEAVCTDHACRK